jgi:hypothetical protein
MVWTISDLGEVGVFFNEGNGTFPDDDAYPLDFDAFTGGLGAGDIDRDGDSDLVASFAYSHESPILLLNDGDGSFQRGQTFNTSPTVTPGLAVGDLDGDGAPDIAAISGGIRIYLNDGQGGFGEPLVHDPEVLLSSASRITLADMNGDGATDLVIPGGLSDQVGVLLNDGDAGLLDESLHGAGDYAVDAAVADLDGDGWPDIVVANRDDESVSVLLSAATTASAPSADAAPSGIWLLAPQPNPFTLSTTVRFGVPVAGRASLAVYGIDGRLVRALRRGVLEAGEHQVAWDGRTDLGREAPAGTYVFRLEAVGTNRETKALKLY